MIPTPKETKAKIEEKDREIDRLFTRVTEEKAETKTVTDGLRVTLRYNRLIHSAIRAKEGSTETEPMLLPFGLG